jgi:hypothetical protein
MQHASLCALNFVHYEVKTVDMHGAMGSEHEGHEWADRLSRQVAGAKKR